MLTQADEFEAIYSRDVFLHIADKVRLFGVLRQALKQDGKLLFTDYACGRGPWHPDFGDYVATRTYHLHTTDAYAQLIERAGFHDVRVADWTDRLIQILLQDLDTIASLDLPVSDKDALTQSWQSKLARAHGGEHRWIKASATSA